MKITKILGGRDDGTPEVTGKVVLDEGDAPGIPEGYTLAIEGYFGTNEDSPNLDGWTVTVHAESLSVVWEHPNLDRAIERAVERWLSLAIQAEAYREEARRD